MNAVISASLITAIGGFILAAATYWLTKARERDAELRKEKLEHYKAFFSALNYNALDFDDQTNRRAAISACNNLYLVAPQHVLGPLQEYLFMPQNLSEDEKNSLLTDLLRHMRRDLHIKPKDDEKTFRVKFVPT